jgi:hypothetical protein
VTNQRSFLWEDDAIVDQNTLVPAGSGLQLQFASQINERGEIGGFGALENGDPRASILVPFDLDDESEATPSATGRETPVSASAHRPVYSRSGRNAQPQTPLPLGDTREGRFGLLKWARWGETRILSLPSSLL